MKASDPSVLDQLTVEFFRSFSHLPDAALIDGDGVFGVRTMLSLPFFSGIATSRLDAADAGAVADRILEMFQTLARPFRWWISPSTQPRNMGEILAARGLRHVYDSPGMTCALDGRAVSAGGPSDLRIARVTTPEQLQTWEQVFMTGFSRPPEDAGKWVESYMQCGLDESSQWRHFMGISGGEVVAISSVLFCGDLAGIYNVVTLPAARGRGVGAAITRAAMRDGQEAGAKVAVLQASAMGRSVYESLGFQTVGDLSVYDWRPEY